MPESTKKYLYEPPTIAYNHKLIQTTTPAASKPKVATRASQLDDRRRRDIVIKLIQFIKSL